MHVFNFLISFEFKPIEKIARKFKGLHRLFPRFSTYFYSVSLSTLKRFAIDPFCWQIGLYHPAIAEMVQEAGSSVTQQSEKLFFSSQHLPRPPADARYHQYLGSILSSPHLPEILAVGPQGLAPSITPTTSISSSFQKEQDRNLSTTF